MSTEWTDQAKYAHHLKYLNLPSAPLLAWDHITTLKGL